MIIAIIVCNTLFFSTIKLQQFSIITKFTRIYNSSNSHYNNKRNEIIKYFTSAFCLNSTISAQKQKDLVTITGKVSDYNGNPIDNCSVMFQNSNFDVLFETKTDEKGKYQINIPKGKYSNIGAINMDTYPHTMKVGTNNENLRLEFWGWNFIADRDTTLNIQYNRMEAYGMHVFKSPELYQPIRSMSVL